jgi:exodeoxyribonuclease VII large subunit
VDFTIADFVADLRAPTPSAAAEIVAKSSSELLEQISALRRRLIHTIERRLAPLREVRHLRQRILAAVQRRYARLETALHLRARLVQSMRSRLSAYQSAITRFSDLLRLQQPMLIVNERRQRLDDLVERAAAAIGKHLAEAKHCSELLSARLKALDPTSILARGYSITYDVATQQILRRADDTEPGRLVRVVLYQGELRANVVATTGVQDCGAHGFSFPSAPQPELPLFMPDDERGT